METKITQFDNDTWIIEGDQNHQITKRNIGGEDLGAEVWQYAVFEEAPTRLAHGDYIWNRVSDWFDTKKEALEWYNANVKIATKKISLDKNEDYWLQDIDKTIEWYRSLSKNQLIEVAQRRSNLDVSHLKSEPKSTILYGLLYDEFGEWRMTRYYEWKKGYKKTSGVVGNAVLSKSNEIYNYLKDNYISSYGTWIPPQQNEEREFVILLQHNTGGYPLAGCKIAAWQRKWIDNEFRYDLIIQLGLSVYGNDIDNTWGGIGGVRDAESREELIRKINGLTMENIFYDGYDRVREFDSYFHKNASIRTSDFKDRIKTIGLHYLKEVGYTNFISEVTANNLCSTLIKEASRRGLQPEDKDLVEDLMKEIINNYVTAAKEGKVDFEKEANGDSATVEGVVGGMDSQTQPLDALSHSKKKKDIKKKTKEDIEDFGKGGSLTQRDRDFIHHRDLSIQQNTELNYYRYYFNNLGLSEEQKSILLRKWNEENSKMQFEKWVYFHKEKIYDLDTLLTTANRKVSVKREDITIGSKVFLLSPFFCWAEVLGFEEGGNRIKIKPLDPQSRPLDNEGQLPLSGEYYVPISYIRAAANLKQAIEANPEDRYWVWGEKVRHDVFLNELRKYAKDEWLFPQKGDWVTDNIGVIGEVIGFGELGKGIPAIKVQNELDDKVAVIPIQNITIKNRGSYAFEDLTKWYDYAWSPKGEQELKEWKSKVKQSAIANPTSDILVGNIDYTDVDGTVITPREVRILTHQEPNGTWTTWVVKREKGREDADLYHLFDRQSEQEGIEEGKQWAENYIDKVSKQKEEDTSLIEGDFDVDEEEQEANQEELEESIPNYPEEDEVFSPRKSIEVQELKDDEETWFALEDELTGADEDLYLTRDAIMLNPKDKWRITYKTPGQVELTNEDNGDILEVSYEKFEEIFGEGVTASKKLAEGLEDGIFFIKQSDNDTYEIGQQVPTQEINTSKTYDFKPLQTGFKTKEAAIDWVNKEYGEGVENILDWEGDFVDDKPVVKQSNIKSMYVITSPRATKEMAASLEERYSPILQADYASPNSIVLLADSQVNDEDVIEALQEDFNVDEIKKVSSIKKGSVAYARELLWRLLRSKEVDRIEQMNYTGDGLEATYTDKTGEQWHVQMSKLDTNRVEPIAEETEDIYSARA